MTGNMTGRVFNNRYQITERIGIGGMAEVYRAQDNVLGRLVAVKVMLPQYAADPNFTARFKQEAAAAANLQSPYIVNVYDWGQDDGTYFIVMEFVRGSDLKTAINQRGAINQRKVAEIGAQVCQALSVAHNLDIIHRDIKPQNIMVQPDGNVKVMDFGIARAKNSVMTQTSSVLGTAHYISPEQAQGKELTATSDIYSLGIVLYESATGKLPFDGPDAVSVAMKQVNDLPSPPSDINPDIDPALESIIMKALAKNPLERFATAQDMRFALNDYLAGRPVSLGGFASAETSVMDGVVAPMPMSAADGTAVMPAIGGSGIKPAGTSSGAKKFRSNESKPKNNKKTIAIVVGIVAALAIVGGIAFSLMNTGESEAIPGVTGKTVEEATTELEKAGFKVGSTDTKYDEKVEAGKVISQDPTAGTKREKGSKVNLTVSQGVEQITVPDLTGKTADEAKQALKDKGLVPNAGAGQYSDTIEKGLVVSTNPAAGQQVAKGSAVEYYPSLGSEGISVPDVVGQRKGAATTTLNNTGFLVTFDEAYSNSVPEGTVISQNPTPGTKLKSGESVNIVVSLGKEKPTSFSVTASVSSDNGTVSPTSLNVNDGESVTFTVTPNKGYSVGTITDTNNKSYTVSSNGGSFTISEVKNNLGITVSFVKQETPTPPAN